MRNLLNRQIFKKKHCISCLRYFYQAKNKAIGIRDDLPQTRQDLTSKRTSSFFCDCLFISVFFFFQPIENSL